MKRFVTYLYECERGNKSKNVGFVRVNIRGEETSMEVYIRNLMRNVDMGRLYALVYKEMLCGVELSDIKLENGQSDTCIKMQTSNIMEREFSINDIEGIAIRLDSGVYIASCWKDEYAEEITRGEFVVEEEIAEKEIVEEVEEQQVEQPLVAAQDSPMTKEIVRDGPNAIYEKIDLSQIRDLPSPNWHLATNSFLVHGFWNYGYLVLKKNVEAGETLLSLGVPGIFEKPEAVMAMLFGFPEFEAISSEINEKEKNQEAEVGTFGYWFVNLKM